MGRSLIVALAQITGRAFEPEANLARTVEVAGEAFGAGAGLVVLPELIVPGYVLDRDGQAAVAEAVDGPAVSAWRRLAEAHGGYIAGGFAERDGGRIFNSAVLVGPEGIVLHYRKLHLFDAEKEIFAPGDLGLPVGETRFGPMGLCVCYDLRFIEVLRALALSGADLVACPTAWVAGFDRQQWDAEGYCPQARGGAMQANLSQVFLACASQVGTAGSLTFLGSSILADPWGKAAIGPLPGDREAVAQATIDLDAAAQARQRSARITPRADRRTDVYGISLNGRLL